MINLTSTSGRILNRFSKDMGSMDELLPPAFFDVLTVRYMATHNSF